MSIVMVIYQMFLQLQDPYFFPCLAVDKLVVFQGKTKENQKWEDYRDLK